MEYYQYGFYVMSFVILFYNVSNYALFSLVFGNKVLLVVKFKHKDVLGILFVFSFFSDFYTKLSVILILILLAKGKDVQKPQ